MTRTSELAKLQQFKEVHLALEEEPVDFLIVVSTVGGANEASSFEYR